jgi:hypothetical protein
MNRIRSSFALVYLLPLLALTACGGADTAVGTSEQAVVVAPRGSATTLDVANWNVEWFGNTAIAPTNDALQQANVRDTILGTDFDVWGLEEVVTASAFTSLKAGLPGWAGVLSNDVAVTNRAAAPPASSSRSSTSAAPRSTSRAGSSGTAPPRATPSPPARSSARARRSWSSAARPRSRRERPRRSARRPGRSTS